ncbi:sodium/calcium exchanger NCL1-like [Nicotiana sylvestris]
MASFSFFFITILIFVFPIIEGRILKLEGSESTQLISNGVEQFKNQSDYLILGSSKAIITSGDECKHIYGFFPCAENIGGYIFMIFTFQYLLILGEKVLSQGSNRLFSILDTGIFGASIFPTLITWPRIVMAFVSGLVISREQAQLSVSSALGSNVGSSVLNLTVLWGICVILGRQNISGNSNTQSADSSSSTLKMKDLKSTGIITNDLTGYIAGVMFLSLAPFIIMLFIDIISSSVGKRITILVALIVSVTLLLSYFAYQMWNPLIQEKCLEYIRYENLVKVFVEHIQRQARGNLFKDGRPDINVLKGLFTKADKDRSNSITLTELEELVNQLESGKVKVDSNFALSTLSRIFDKNGDERINEEEFIEGCKKLIRESKGDSTSIKKYFDEVVKAYTEGQQKEVVKIQELMPRVLTQIQNQAIESEGLLKDDGSPNIEAIKRLFHKLDDDQNSYLTPSELEKLTENVKIREAHLDHQGSIEEIIKDFDQNKDNKIDENEFLDGVKYWLRNAKRSTEELQDKMIWGEVDKFLDEAKREKHKRFDYSLVLKGAFCKSVLQVILGTAILTLCADPLMDNIIRLANAIGMPSFFLSFIIVPLAINARTAITAISLLSSTSQQSSTTSSLTFSEIYVRVILNNIMGMSTVLFVLYAKDLTWEYSVEVLTSMVVCAVTGLFAFVRTTYPLWTCIIAFLLYPISLVLLYLFH